MSRYAWLRLAVALTMVLGSLCWLVIPARASWQDDLKALLATDDAAEQGRLLTAVVDAAPGWEDVAATILGQPYTPATSTGLSLRTSVCLDGVERPWVLYVPEGYDPARPTPLLIALHGGVMQPEVSADPIGDLTGGDSEDPYIILPRELGMLAVYPQADEHSTWWDEVGMANIDSIVRTVKREFNVDDNRVYMLGYSDGASGGFAWAMTKPTDLAAVFALSGHMGVGSLDGKLDLYAPNMANLPVYAVTSYADQLYPSEELRGTIKMALDAGADITYREQEGGHDFSYAGAELPLIRDFVLSHARNPIPARITWETASREFGRCHWLAIDRLALTPPAPWHTDFNYALMDDRVTIGYQPDEEYSGEGAKVALVIEESFAAKIGLQVGDVIVQLDELPVKSQDDVAAWKKTVKRGDAVAITVLRDGNRVTLTGALLEVALYNLFKRERPSAKAVAVAYGNHIEILASRVAALRIMVHPALFRLERTLVVTINGREVYNAMVAPDLTYMLRNYLADRDSSLLYVAEVKLEVGE